MSISTMASRMHAVMIIMIGIERPLLVDDCWIQTCTPRLTAWAIVFPWSSPGPPPCSLSMANSGNVFNLYSILGIYELTFFRCLSPLKYSLETRTLLSFVVWKKVTTLKWTGYELNMKVKWITRLILLLPELSTVPPQPRPSLYISSSSGKICVQLCYLAADFEMRIKRKYNYCSDSRHSKSGRPGSLWQKREVHWCPSRWKTISEVSIMNSAPSTIVTR